MKIGVIGLGMVGEAVAYGLRRIGHEVVGYDIDPAKKGEPLPSLLLAKLIFVCVPTPSLASGACNVDIVHGVLVELAQLKYHGLVVIKSTVPPGTTDACRRAYSLRLAFCPEFLRERARFSDFVDNHDLCIAGAFNEKDADLIRQAHGSLPKHFVWMTPTEAELAKYFVNCFNGYRVNFANAFYDVCQKLNAHYPTIKDAVCKRTGMTGDYLTCNEQTRGFSGACLPKDTKAFATFVKTLGLETPLFERIVLNNERPTERDLIHERRIA